MTEISNQLTNQESIDLVSDIFFEWADMYGMLDASDRSSWVNDAIKNGDFVYKVTDEYIVTRVKSVSSIRLIITSRRDMMTTFQSHFFGHRPTKQYSEFERFYRRLSRYGFTLTQVDKQSIYTLIDFIYEIK
jgi:hypothetical protein